MDSVTGATLPHAVEQESFRPSFVSVGILTVCIVLYPFAGIEDAPFASSTQLQIMNFLLDFGGRAYPYFIVCSPSASSLETNDGVGRFWIYDDILIPVQ